MYKRRAGSARRSERRAGSARRTAPLRSATRRCAAHRNATQRNDFLGVGVVPPPLEQSPLRGEND